MSFLAFIPAIALGIVAGFFMLASLPTPGGVEANEILLIPAVFFGGLGIIAALVAWAF